MGSQGSYYVCIECEIIGYDFIIDADIVLQELHMPRESMVCQNIVFSHVGARHQIKKCEKSLASWGGRGGKKMSIDRRNPEI
jgi:hypothetical protein